MFHLLVNYAGWAQGRDSLSSDRILKYTDPRLVEWFAPDGTFNLQRLAEVPALLASEKNGKGPQCARIGAITDIRVQGAIAYFQYALDERIPPVPMLELERLVASLQIDSFELIHSHWAIKDADLCKELLCLRLAPFLAPKVFLLEHYDETDMKLVSAMMPFDARFADIYATIQSATAELGMTCKRADDIWQHDAIVQDIVALIHKSRVVICDCSTRNANVFYETGIAHTMGRDVILITQSEDDVPFDLRHLRYVKYLNNVEGREQLRRQLCDRIRTLTQPPAR